MQALMRREGLIDALHRSRSEELDELNRAHRPERHLSLLGAWARGWLRRPARVEAEPQPPIVHGEVGITFVGHASVILRWAQLSVAVNPFLGRRVGLVPRAVEPGARAYDLAACDLILITGDAPDVLHPPTLRRMSRRATIVVPPRCAGLVSKLGFARVVELGMGSSMSQRGLDVVSTAVRARGPACAYVLRGDGPSLYYCAGSGYFSGFADVGARYRPDIALLPISGYTPHSFREEHLSPIDALYAFEDLHARMLIPIRHGTFVLSYERLEEPMRWLRRLIAERDLGTFMTELGVGMSRKFVDLG
jgi:L-ascorbate metabolism protein UlaG (beta-lactamase superfamily)